MSIKDGRQWATSLSEIRRDHLERYRWAATKASGTVADFGCGCGYGTNVLANTGRASIVTAYDLSVEALAFGRQHWDHKNIEWILMDLEGRGAEVSVPFNWAIAFEIIEHLEAPQQFLRAIDANHLLCSAPNETVMPFDPKRHSYHHRHYTRGEFDALLTSTGWRVAEWYTQIGKASPVTRGDNGMTLIAECQR